MEQIKKGNARLVFDFEDGRDGIMTGMSFTAHKDCEISEEEIFMALVQGLQELAQRFDIDFGMSVTDLDDHETVQ